jgi:hypothetical protein
MFEPHPFLVNKFILWLKEQTLRGAKMNWSVKITDAIFLRLLACVAALVAVLFLPASEILTVVYFRTQDVFVALVLCSALALSTVWLPRGRLPAFAPSQIAIGALATILALALWRGTYMVMFDYPLTRDEHMVVFDAGVFATGEWAAHLPAYWNGYAEALVPEFLLDVPDNALLISAYMPGNAMMRAAFDTFADPALMNPILVAAGLIALHDIARRIFKDNPGAIWVALAGYVLSSQVLVAAMTTYAMSAHLALNIMWLALFLRNKWWQHMLAMAIGAWAIGLHQIVFHPLFAGPFILTLLAQRRWSLFAAYSVVYAGALLFWIGYPSMIAAEYEIIAQSGSTGGILNFISDRVVSLFVERGDNGTWFMLYNVMRFVAWAPLFLLPLMFFAWPAVRSNSGQALPLFAGCMLTLAAMFLLLAYQGHGWGYRYMHGLIGNFALLAGYGYARWAERDANIADGAVILLGGVTAVLILPFLLWSAHDFTRPYVQLQQLIERQSSDFVIVDTEPPSPAVDQVRNPASLNLRPLILSSRAMTKAQADEICTRGTVTLITRQDFQRAGFVRNIPTESPKFDDLVRNIRKRDCILPTI